MLKNRNYKISKHVFLERESAESLPLLLGPPNLTFCTYAVLNYILKSKMFHTKKFMESTVKLKNDDLIQSSIIIL